MDLKAIWHGCQAAAAVIGGGLGWFMGGWDGLFITLVVFTGIDYLTGVMCAIIEKRLSSEIGKRGIFKKVLIFALVGIGYTIDANLIGEGSIVRTAVILFFISNEGLSLLENAGRIGLPIPGKLRDALTQIHAGGKKSL